MKLELIGASLDGFYPESLIFISEENQLVYTYFSRLELKVQGFLDIYWLPSAKNSIIYRCHDEFLNESILNVTYDDGNDWLYITLNEERYGYDPKQIYDEGYLDSFEPGEVVTHFAEEIFEISEASKTTRPILSKSAFGERTRRLLSKWCEEYNLELTE